MNCNIELDDKAWDYVFAYNGAPKQFSESVLDDEYCMRCGSDEDNCTCEVPITEETFDEFMNQWAYKDDLVYEMPARFVERSCYDCEYLTTPQCGRLLDYIHRALLDFGADIESFPKITICDQFTQYKAPERIN